MFFRFVTQHACDGRTDGQNYDSYTNELTATEILLDFPYIMGFISTLNGISYVELLPCAHCI